jgi:hypothetical protein
MSITIQEKFTIDGVLTDVTSVLLSDPTAAYGVKRNDKDIEDPDAIVVADATAMTKVSTGVYRYTFAEPAVGLAYTYWVEWVYAGQTYRDEHTVTGTSASAGRICTLADVKDRLGESGAEHDTLLDRLIASLESLFDSYTGRHLMLPSADVTEYYSGRGPFLQLRRYPLVAITSIKVALDYDFTAADALVANTDYRIVNNGLNGILVRIYSVWDTLQDSIQVIYRGGYCAAGVTPGEGQTALPDDLREAAIEQATFFFKRRDDLGLSSVSFQGGAISKFGAVDLLPIVKRVLDNYVLLTV